MLLINHIFLYFGNKNQFIYIKEQKTCHHSSPSQNH